LCILDKMQENATVKARFYEYFMTGHDKRRLNEFYSKYNQNPSKFHFYLKEKTSKKIQKRTNREKPNPQSISNVKKSSIKMKIHRKLRKSTIKKRRYKCAHCLRLFKSEKLFLMHLLIFSRRNSKKKFQADLCSKLIKKYLLALKKINLKHKCLKCKLSFYTKINLSKHLLSHIEYNCNQCDSKFQSEYSLVLHRCLGLRKKNKDRNSKRIHKNKRSQNSKSVNNNLQKGNGMNCSLQ
jgi:hypothetical protein